MFRYRAFETQNLWYMAAGLSQGQVLGAWRAKGALSYAASLINLVSPYDTLTPHGTPDWGGNTGWGLLQTRQDYFITAVNPPINSSLIIRFSNGSNLDGSICGAWPVAANSGWGIWPRYNNGISPYQHAYFNGSQANPAPALATDETLAIAGQYGYRNGVVDTSAIAPPSNPVGHVVALGAWWKGSTSTWVYSWQGNIVCAAIYSTVLTPAQVAQLNAQIQGL